MADAKAEAPETSRRWESMAKNLDLQNKTIHNMSLPSGSKFKFEQFLLLRVLWKEHENIKSVLVPGMKDWIERATEMLRQYKSWSTYCASFQTPEDSPEGTFAIARYYQREAAKTENKADPGTFFTPISARTRSAVDADKDLHKGLHGLSLGSPKTPSRPGRAPLPRLPDLDDELASDDDSIQHLITSTSTSPSPITLISPIPAELRNLLYPRSKDEQIVNTALIVFLNALTIHFPLSLKWTLHRKAFVALFENTQFEARTDGYLDSPGGNPKVIIEVKAALRSSNLLPIQMQESAQMVAWIKSDTELARKTNTTRFHISQDRHQVYITVAQYDEKYLEYIVDGKLSPDRSFLTMNQYGPWDTTEGGHMRVLGPILLAIALRAEQEGKEEESEN
ncbi:hypothetical protein CBS147354_7481 [Penicillium roqueforti]|nr:hypothetical protein CBS147354_7481 [Penicillium roqueforti]